MQPTASFDSSCTELECQFTDSSTGSDVSWSWNFGDDTTSISQNPIHPYTAGDTYTVSLTVRDNDGATNTITHDVTVSLSGSGELVGSSENNGRTWTAIVIDTSGATLAGTWDYAGNPSCTGNECSLSGIPKNKGSVVFTSGSESVTVSKP